jgi:pimeloyl-ACP methyl ester carboxylesterase
MSNVERRWVAFESETAQRYRFGSYAHQGVYHHLKGTRPTVAFIATHHVVDYTDHYMATPLAERGFGFLGWNTRYRGDDAYFHLEHALVDVGFGVRWLRDVAGVDNVVLLGNSGGGSLMATYQAQASNPDTLDLSEAGRGIAGMHDIVRTLSPGDLYVSVNSHQGRPDVLTAWMDPAVVDEHDLLATDPALDMFNPDNGPPYSEAFIAGYRQAQRDRNHRITSWAQEQLGLLKEIGIRDRMFVINRLWADLRFLDLGIDPSDRAPGCYWGDPRNANYGSFGLATCCTLRSWLSMWSLETAQCRGAAHLRNIRVPSLVVQSTGDQGVFPSDARAIFDSLGAEDKSLELVRGAHYFEADERAFEDVLELIADWTTKRTAW